jgi:hypothetical protein
MLWRGKHDILYENDMNVEKTILENGIGKNF